MTVRREVIIVPTATITLGGPPTPTNTPTPIVETVNPNEGGEVAYTDSQGNETTITVPAGAVDEPTELHFTPRVPDNAPSDFQFAGHSFTLDAYQNGELQESFNFQQAIQVNLTYSDEDVQGMNEQALILFYWDKTNNEWVDAATSCEPPSLYDRHTDENRFSLDICHLTEFGLFGESSNHLLFLPTIIR